MKSYPSITIAVDAADGLPDMRLAALLWWYEQYRLADTRAGLGGFREWLDEVYRRFFRDKYDLEVA